MAIVDGVLGVAYSFLAFPNGDVFIGIGHDRGALIYVYEGKQW